MPSLGNLDNFLTEKDRIVDYSWLDIDPKDYKNMPFDDTPEYIAVPKLQEAWRHLEDTNINLIPNTINIPKKPEIPLEQNIYDVLKFSKRQMMAGKKGKDLVKLIQDYASPEIIKAASKYLSALKEEYGLLGNVYIDPSVFSKCSEGAKFLEKKAKTARFVKEMSKCSGCVFNDCGRCQVYKRKISAEIPYDDKTLSFYSKHLSDLKGKKIVAGSKEELRKSFLMEILKPRKMAENKPIEKLDPTEEKTLEEKKKKFEKDLDNLKEELSKVTLSKVSHDISHLLIKGYDGQAIKNHIKQKYSVEDREKYNSVISSVLSQQGSLGKVYIDAKNIPYKDCFEAKNYLNQNSPGSKYLVTEKPFCKCRPFGQGWGKSCLNTNKIVIPSTKKIPKTEWMMELNKFPKEIADKMSFFVDQDPIKALRLANLKYDLSKKDKGPIHYDTLEVKAQLDPNKFVGSETRKISFTSKKVSSALDKGYPLSSIIKTGKSLGASEKEIEKGIKEALEERKSINKFQVDIPINIPSNLTVQSSQKDVSIDLGRPITEIPEFAAKSSYAPVDTLVNDFNLKNPGLNVDIKKRSDIEVTGLDVYNI